MFTTLEAKPKQASKFMLRIATQLGNMESATAAPKRTLFILDCSPSMSGWKLQASKDAIISVLDSYTDRDSAAFMVFDAGARTLLPFTRCDAGGRDRAENIIRGSGIGDGTQYYPALEEALRLFAQPDPGFKNLVNFSSDGEDYDHRDAVSLCDQLRAKGVSIYTGGIGMEPKYRDTLIAMAKGQFAPANNADELRSFFEGVDAQISLSGVTNVRVVLNPVDFVTVQRFHGATKGDDGNYVAPDALGKTVNLGDMATGDQLACFAQLQVVLPDDIDAQLKPKSGQAQPPKDSIRRAFGYVEVFGDVAAFGLTNHKITEIPIVVKFALKSSAAPNEDVVTFYRVANSVYELAQGNVSKAAEHMDAAAQTQQFSASSVAKAMAARMKAMRGKTGEALKADIQGATVQFDPGSAARARARLGKK